MPNLDQAQSLSGTDYERADQAISQYINLNTLEITGESNRLSQVSLRWETNQGTGGPPSDPTREYVIQLGDTLSTIADRYGLSSGSLVLANSDLKDTELIHPGQVLTIPAQAFSESELAVERDAREKKLTASGSLTKAGSFPSKRNFRVPVSYSYKSRGFNPASHYGDDLVASANTPIYASETGQIISNEYGYNGGYGNLIKIDHGNGVTTRYGHLLSFVKGITRGVWVEKGQIIGYVGSTGNSTGPHLHFEIRVNGVAVDPGM